jgi:hypothetical protein
MLVRRIVVVRVKIECFLIHRWFISASNDVCLDKYLKRVGCLTILSRDLPITTEENHEKLQSGFSVIMPRLELSVST